MRSREEVRFRRGIEGLKNDFEESLSQIETPNTLKAKASGNDHTSYFSRFMLPSNTLRIVEHV